MEPRAVALIAALLLPAFATAQPVPDHLKCYKVKDSRAKATYTADLGGLVSEPGCLIKVPGTMLCVEATKTNIKPVPPGGTDNSGPAGRFLCYKVKCPKAVLTPLAWHDQFGTGTITPSAPKLLCAPEILPTTTTTTTTGSTSTSTTICTPTTCAALGANCGPISDGCGGMIDCGICPALQLCGGGGTPNVCASLNPACVPVVMQGLPDLEVSIPTQSFSGPVVAGTVCPMGPDPTAAPPTCVAEIPLAGVTLTPSIPLSGRVLLTGTIPFRVADLPVQVQLASCAPTITAAVDGDLTCPGGAYDALPVAFQIGYGMTGTGLPVVDSISTLDPTATAALLSNTTSLCGIGACADACTCALASTNFSGLPATLVGVIQPPLTFSLTTLVMQRICRMAEASNPCPSGTTADSSGICRYPSDPGCVPAPALYAASCGCLPTTCTALGSNCGPISDGCGGTLDCGLCTAPATCGGGGVPNQCGGGGCTPTTCAALGANCGSEPDGCGGMLDCGTCTPPATCIPGANGVPNRCGGCVPQTCATTGANCGSVNDGCGGTLDCGLCTAPATCGGGGVPNQCGSGGCTPTTCATLGLNCGPFPDGCGGTLDCGTCTPPLTCGGGGKQNHCG